MRINTLLACAIASVGFACGTTSKAENPGGAGGYGGGGGSGGEEPVALPESADHERLGELVRALASPEFGGRRSGLSSGEKTEEYLREFFDSLGLEVVEQEVELPVPELAAPTVLEVLEGDEVIDSFRYLEEYRELRWSGAGDREGELVFLGHGVVAGPVNAYDGLDVSGKIVSVLAKSPKLDGVEPLAGARLDNKVAAAKAAGAVGVVFVPNGPYANASLQQGPEMEMIAGDGTYGFDPEVHADDMPVVFLHHAATSRLLGAAPEELESMAPFETGKRVHLELHATARMGSCNNILAVMRGEGPKEESVVVLGAHHDHLGIGADGVVFPGASDNATGAAVVLETAASLAATGRTPARTVVFALFCGEELGLYGSNYYVAHPPVSLEYTRLMVQFDYFGNEGPLYLANFDGERLITDFVGDAQEHPDFPLNKVNWQGQCASDDCGFLAHGVPAYRFLAEGDHHHRTTDSCENLSMPLVERVADLAVVGLGKVAF